MCPRLVVFLLAGASLGAARLPVAFERNTGQAPAEVRVLAPGAIALLDGGAFRSRGIEIRLAGADRRATPTTLDPLPGHTNYFLGGDPARWRTGIAQYARVRYRNVYPGIDLVFHGSEYDFAIAPHADPARIGLEFRGARPHLEQGDLVAGPLRQHRPRAHQVVHGSRREVAAEFILCGRSARFRLGPYDASVPLVIDPVIEFVTYLGGSRAETTTTVAVDGSGNIYVGGATNSGDFPTTSGPLGTSNPAGRYSAFVTKLSPDGSTILYSTYLGGDGDSGGSGMVVDAAGNAYLTGSTLAGAHFPVTPGGYRTYPDYGFIAKLSPTGDGLLYSAVFTASPSSIAIDAAGSAYVTGIAAGDFVSTPGVFQRSLAPGVCMGLHGNTGPCQDSFILKLRPDGAGPVYATYLGGADTELARGIAVDSAGNAVVTGETVSANFPVTPNAIQPSFHGKVVLGPTSYGDAFVTKLNAAGSALVYSTYLGGSAAEFGMAVALDPAGNAYAAGNTSSIDFPTTPGVLHPTYIGTPPSPPGSGGNGFLTRIDPSGRLLASTFLPPFAGTLAVDGGGYAYLNMANPLDYSPCVEPKITILTPSADAIADAGASGAGPSGSSRLVLDGKGFAYVAGMTSARIFFATPGTVQPEYGGGDSDAFVARFALSGVPRTAVRCGVNAATQWPGEISVVPEGAVAPGEIFTLYGSALGPDTGVAADASSDHVPAMLAGTRVLFDGLPAPLLWVQANQINAVVPYGVNAPSTAMTIERNGETYGPWKLPVADAVPGIFTMDGSGTGQAAALNEDGTPNSPSHPAAKGSVIAFYATGAGRLDPPLPDGAIAGTVLPLPQPHLGVSVRIGSFDAPVEYGGAAPGLVNGAIQVNVRVPEGAPTGDAVPVVVYFGNYGSGVAGWTSLPGRATIAIR